MEKKDENKDMLISARAGGTQIYVAEVKTLLVFSKYTLCGVCINLILN